MDKPVHHWQSVSLHEERTPNSHPADMSSSRGVKLLLNTILCGALEQSATGDSVRPTKRHRDQLGCEQSKAQPNAALQDQFKRPSAETDSWGGGLALCKEGVCVQKVAFYGRREYVSLCMFCVGMCVWQHLLLPGLYWCLAGSCDDAWSHPSHF